MIVIFNLQKLILTAFVVSLIISGYTFADSRLPNGSASNSGCVLSPEQVCAINQMGDRFYSCDDTRCAMKQAAEIVGGRAPKIDCLAYTLVPSDCLENIVSEGLKPGSELGKCGANAKSMWFGEGTPFCASGGRTLVFQIDDLVKCGGFSSTGLAGQSGVIRVPDSACKCIPFEKVIGIVEPVGKGFTKELWRKPGYNGPLGIDPSSPPSVSNCTNGPALSGPPKLNTPTVTINSVGSGSGNGPGRGIGVGSTSKAIFQSGVSSCKKNIGKVVLSTCLDPKGLAKEVCVSGAKGAIKSGPFIACDIATQVGTRCAVDALGGTENQKEGACALASIGSGAACGGCVAGPPGAAIGAGIAGTVEVGSGVCKIGYYTTTSFYNYGVCQSVGSWWEEGYNPIDYWCGY